MRYRELLQQAAAELEAVGIEDAELDSRLLLETAGSLSRTELYLRANKTADDTVVRKYQELIGRRKKREPLAYIICEQEFYGYPFYVSPAVLVPRPETELLVEAALNKSAAANRRRILEICTGSGAAAVTLALELGKERKAGGEEEKLFICASDISTQALAVASRNAIRHSLSAANFSLVQSDMLTAFAPESFALILANPPYICDTDIANLMPEVRDFEPHLALAGGRDGLELIRKIEYQLRTVLAIGGDFFMEFGAGQGEAVRQIFSGAVDGTCCWQLQEIIKDYAGLERILWVKKVKNVTCV